jgi:DNA modification methylase
MEGEVVYDPFMGIGSVGYQALKMRRRAVGTELNEDYWRFAVGYAEAVEAEMDVPTLFDLNGIGRRVGAAA